VRPASGKRSGAYIYHNSNVLNEYRTAQEFEKYQADYEKKYLRFENLPQPSVSGSSSPSPSIRRKHAPRFPANIC
jgi:hypothetical protein